MRVLIQSYNTCCQIKSGGVQIRIKNLVNTLKKFNVKVEYFNAFTSNLDNCDILHIFMLNIESVALARMAKAKGKKIVLSSIINCVGGKKIDFYKLIRKTPISTTYKFLFELVEISDLIIVESQEEKNFLVNHFNANNDKITIIYNGASDFSYGNNEIYDLIGKEKEYVLEVGRFDKNKNQLNVIRALKDTDINIVFIGGANPNEESYYEKCKNEAKGCKNIFFLGWIDNQSELMKSAYTNAKVLISSSFSETFGITIIEGAIAGANLVLSNTLSILENPLFSSCLTFDPKNPSDIREKIESSLHMNKNKEFQNIIKSNFTWENIAKKHFYKYKELLDND